VLHSKGFEQRQGHRVLAVVGAFRLLRVGSTHVQLHSQKTKFISLSQSLNQYNLKYINFMHKYTANIPKILTLCDYCDKLLTRLEIIVSFIMSLKTKYGGK